MQQAGIGAPSLQRHVERFDRDVSIIDGADGPTHDEPREQIQDGREVQLAAAADDELRRVTDPSLIGTGRLEATVEQIRRHRLIVVAHRRGLESLPGARFETVFLHQADDALATDALGLLDQILVNARAAVSLATLIERRTYQHLEPSIGPGVRGLRAPTRSVEAARRDLQVLTELGDRELGLLRVDPGEDYAWFLAKKAAAFFRMSRSMRNSRLSLRRLANSARSSVVSPVRPLVRSARAC